MNRKITYRVQSNDYGSFWRAESGGIFTVGDSQIDFPTDADAREAAIEYARTIAGNGTRTRVVRQEVEIIFDTAATSHGSNVRGERGRT